MTVTDVRKRVETIREAAGDDEIAHGMEDRLRDDVLIAIADGDCEDAAALAREALLTSEISFTRWCA